MSRRFRKLALAFGSLVLVILVSVAVISTPWVQRFIGRWAISQLEAATGARIEIRDFHFQPLILRFVFQGLVLHGKEPSSGPTLFSGETVVVQLSPRALLRRRLALRSLDWDGVEIHLLTFPDGSTNLPEPAAALQGPEGVAADLSIGRASLNRTKFFWDEERLRADVGAHDIAILARRVARGRYAGSLASQDVWFRNDTLRSPPASVNARFEISAAGLELNSLTWQGAGFRGNGQLTLKDWRSPRVTFSYQSEADGKELAHYLNLPHLRGGKFESRGQITYAKQDFEAQGRATVKQLAADFPLGTLSGISVTADYAGDRSRMRFPQITASGLGGKFQATGEISLQDSPWRFRFQSRIQGVDAQPILDRFHETRGAGGRVRVASEISGTVDMAWENRLDNFRGQFDLNLEAQPGGGTNAVPLVGNIQGVARLIPEPTLDVEDARFQTPASSLSGRGIVGQRQINLTLQATTKSLDEWRPVVESLAASAQPIPLKLDSQASFRGAISGPTSGPELRGRVDCGPFEYRGWKWDAFSADISATSDALAISNAGLDHRGSAVRVTGHLPLKAWAVDSSGPLSLSLFADQTRVEGLTSAVGMEIPLAGTINGSVELQGSPADFSGQGNLNLRNGSIAGEPFNSLSTDLRIEHSTWQFNTIKFAKGEGLAQGRAAFNLPARTFQADIQGAHFRLQDFRRLISVLGLNSPSDLQGDGSFDLHASGRTDDPTVDATASIRKVVARGIPVGDLQARIAWQAGQFKIDGKAAGAGGDLEFTGGGQSAGDWPLHLAGSYTSFRLEPWVRLFATPARASHISITGTVNANAPLKNLSQAELSMKVQNLEISYPKLKWNNAEPVNIHYSQRRLSATRFRLLGPATSLIVEGGIVFDRGGTLSLTLEGDTEATLLSLIDPALEASGKSTLKLRVAGSLGHPSLNGTLHVQDVSVGYGDLPLRITALDGEIRLEGDRASLRSLRGVSGGGTVKLDGFVSLAGVPRFNILANLNQVRLRYPSDFTSLLDGTLRLTGSPEQGQIGGELTVRQVFPTENFNWLTWVGETGGNVLSKGSAMASPFAPRVLLNVQLGSSPAVRFEARDLRLVADIDLRLQGTLANPVTVGTVQILSGEAVFRGNRYTVRRGDITMTNPFRTQPILALEAQTRVQRYDLVVSISGPFDRLKISYRSDPPLPAEDIVTLLAFGYAPQQEAMATGTTHPVATVGASALLSQALSTQVSSRIQRLFGVSRIKIDPNVGGVGTTGGARVTVEQQVAPELTLTYVTSTGPQQYRIIRLEWAVTDRISVIGERDQGGILGMEVRFQRRFK